MDTHGAGAWSSNLFECSQDTKICCMGMCCPCILFGQIRDALTGEGCCVGCMMIFFGCGIGGCLGSTSRREMRMRYGWLQGSNCDDRWYHCGCGPCACCQEAREIQSRSAMPYSLLQGFRRVGFCGCCLGTEMMSTHVPVEYFIYAATRLDKPSKSRKQRSAEVAPE